ncbi:glycosyltransferase family 2 protein [uncultured Dubosiella sp.]|uniref:glycosyltransferase family 2 protein n=2 Tax=uncultured Dubosiella sp. TaxID=1937011 RepID=UPI0025B3469C|nr:glycosyltransferase family 2 protein [uncultured Dubosiella sp.]
MKISILVAIYNSSWSQIRRTLISILNQEFKDIEIIVTDDGSKNNFSKNIEQLFAKYNFSNYKMIFNKVNKGTLRNFYQASLLASGKYLKPIGAGDLLYGPKTLKNVINYMEENDFNSCFGLTKKFYIEEEGEIRIKEFRNPRLLKPYIKNDEKIILRNTFFGDRPYGCAMFFKTSYIQKYWKEMCDKTKVLYCEDIVNIQMALDKEIMPFFPEYVVWYEMNTGVSKSANKSTNDLINKDIRAYLDYLQIKYEDKQEILKLKRWLNFTEKFPQNKKRVLNYYRMPSKFLFELYIRRKEIADYKRYSTVGFLENQKYKNEFIR